MIKSRSGQTARGHRKPTDLHGKRVGVRAYTQTTGMWVRGMLAELYGMDVEKVNWVTFEDGHIAEYKDPEHDPMIPHIIVLEPGLVVFKIYNGYWFFGRPTIEELRQDLRAVLRKCRPDWDITRPELKAAWERGEHDRFYPYGKTYAQVFREQE